MKLKGRILTLVLFVFLISLFPVDSFAVTQNTTSNWSMWGGGANNDFYAPVTLPTELMVRHNPMIQGKKDAVISRGILYTLDRFDEKILYAIDLEGNNIIWQFETDNGLPVNSIAAQNDRLFVMSGKKLYALRDTGRGFEILWTKDTGPGLTGGVISDGTTLYYNYLDRDTNYPSEINRIMAVSSNTGATKWSYNLGPSNEIPSKLVAGDGRLFFTSYNKATMRNNLYAMNAETSQVLWTAPQQPDRSPSSNAPLYKAGKVYADLAPSGGSHTITAYDAAAGKVEWKYTVKNRFGMMPYSNGALIANEGSIFTTDKNGYMIALNKDTGVEQFNVQYTNSMKFFAPHAIATKDKLFIGNNKKIIIMDAKTGALLKDFPLNAVGDQMVAIAGDMLITTDNSRLYGIKTFETGSDVTLPSAHLNMYDANPIGIKATTKRFSSLEKDTPGPLVVFYLSEDAHVELSFTSEEGQTVRRINLGLIKEGWNEYRWDGKDDGGNPVPYGRYYYGFTMKDMAGHVGNSIIRDEIISVGDVVGIVINNSNLRSGPGTHFDVIRVVPIGDKVTVLSDTNNWYEVNVPVDGYEIRGYISKNLVSTASSLKTIQNPPTTTPPSQGGQPTEVYDKYTVQGGDTLGKIAQRFATTIENFVKINTISNPNILHVGQVLNVPAKTTNSVQPVPSQIEHTIQAGETLWMISNRYKVTIDEIVKANNINNPNVLHVGQKLMIPVKPQENPRIIHTVVAGENLWIISHRYNVSMDQIIQLNNLSNANMLFVGQKLTIK